MQSASYVFVNCEPNNFRDARCGPGNFRVLLQFNESVSCKLWVGSLISLPYIKHALSVYIISSLHLKQSNFEKIGKIYKYLYKYRLILEAAAQR